jgi:hypothetical protein
MTRQLFAAGRVDPPIRGWCQTVPSEGNPRPIAATSEALSGLNLFLEFLYRNPTAILSLAYEMFQGLADLFVSLYQLTINITS